MINFQSTILIKPHLNYLSHFVLLSTPITNSHSSRISKPTYNSISFIQFQPFHTTTIQKQQQPSTTNPYHKAYSHSERRVKEPFLSILLPIQENTNQSQSTRVHQSSSQSKSMNPIQNHRPNQIIPKPSDPVHPISKVLNKYQASSQISTTSQLVSEALQSVFDQSTQSNPESCHHTSSDQDWCLIYLKYLQSSKNPIEFSKRLGDLIIKRLPRYRSDQIIQLHSKHTSLRHLISTDSYNQLIKFYYLSNRYDQVRLILKEMKERGLNLNLKTFELILYSYQSLNKSKGVNLTIEKIQNLGLSVSLETWVSLFSIRPRKFSRTRHLDSMQDDSHSLSTIDRFLNGWKWDSAQLHSNGKAIITLSKKLMQDGKWNEAFKFIDTALTLSCLHDTTSTPDSTKKKLSSFWARECLHTLLYGLYNSKQANKKSMRIKGIKSNELSKFKKDSIRSTNSQTPLPLNQSIFKFVEDFIDKHRDYHTIKVNSSILLNCLRIETCHSPSRLQTIIKRWQDNYGLETHKLGSKTSIRILHIVSTWFTKSLQSQPQSTQELIKEYSIMQDFWDSELKGMMKRGPIDGKVKKGLFVFWTCQRIKSIQISLNRLNKIRKKLKIESNEDQGFKLDLDLDFNDEDFNENENDKMKGLKGPKHQQLETKDQVLYRWWSEEPNLKEIKVKV